MSNSAFTQAQIATPVSVSNGGTGATITPTNGQVLIGNGTTYTVGSLTSTGSTLTITGGSGTLNADINLGNSNTWTAAQTMPSINVTGSTIPANGMYLGTANDLRLASGGVLAIEILSNQTVDVFQSMNVGASQTSFFAINGGTTGATMTQQGGSTGTLSFATSGTGAVQFFTNNFATQNLTLKSTGVAQLNTYTAGVAHFDASGNISSSPVARADLGTDAKNWTFLGTATGSGVTVGPVSWTGTWQELLVEYNITGYSGSAVGRLLLGPTAAIDGAGNYCTALLEGITANTSSVSAAGWPTAVTVTNAPRYGWWKILNIAGQVKRGTGHGQYGGTAPTVLPVLMRMEGMWNNTTAVANKAQLSTFTALTGTTISAITFSAGTYLAVWGRNLD